MSSSKNKTVIIVCGPTAVGKTTVAIALAKHFKTEIISADSRQCFKELNIGVARPSPEELAAVNQYFIATHFIHEEVTAITFEQYALQKAKELFLHQDVMVMVGGTGLYIKAFCEGLDEIPEVGAEVRRQITEDYRLKGLEWLQSEIKNKDPLFYTSGEIQNPQRLMRALEVVDATGKSILSFRKGEKAQRDFHIIKIGLELPKEELHRNINVRVDTMMKTGLLKEVESVLPYRNLNALHTVGYAELFDFFDQKMPLEKAVEEIKKHTRQYAKRQMTWFKKDISIKWFHPADINAMQLFAEATYK
jgi:tRNA dimethylallyltransferase